MEKYHYIIMSQNNFLQNQVIEEILRERSSYYNSRKKNPDFWILISPLFLAENQIIEKIRQSKFYKLESNKIKSSLKKQNLEFYVSLVSTDENFIKWIKLRLGYFENLLEILEKDYNVWYTSDGIYGTLNNENRFLLESNQKFIHPDILIERFKNSLEQYF